MAASDEVDLELIGALMDGRLTGAERDRAIKLLGNSEAAFEIYADALRARADLEVSANEEAATVREAEKVIPIATARRRRGRPWMAIGSLAAAAAIMFAVLPNIQSRRQGDDLGGSSSEIAMALMRRPDVARSLPANWDQRGWSVTRGGGSRVLDTAVAFRLGVRAVDLQVALAAADTLHADRLSSEVLEMLERVELSDAVKAEYAGFRQRIAQPAPSEQLGAGALHAERSLDELLDSFWFDFGRWVAVGELAAATRTSEFFADPRTARFLKTIVSRPELSPADVELLREIAGLVGRGVGDGDYDTIRENFRALIRRHGG